MSGRGEVGFRGDVAYAAVQDPAIAVGRFLPQLPGEEQARSVVLSTSAANALAVTAADVGEAVTVDGAAFTLVGVLDDATGFTTAGTASVPMAAARDLVAQAPSVGSVLLAATDGAAVDAVQADADGPLRDRYGLAAEDDGQYSITNPSAVISTVGTVQSLLSVLLGGIASISLLVGGIGIMSIMLVSVRERTREIGVRRAIGARRSQILLQFLVEAVVLSVAGGLVGIVVGIGLSALVAAVAGWALTISPVTVGLAVLFSVVVGWCSGSCRHGRRRGCRWSTPSASSDRSARLATSRPRHADRGPEKWQVRVSRGSRPPPRRRQRMRRVAVRCGAVRTVRRRTSSERRRPSSRRSAGSTARATTAAPLP